MGKNMKKVLGASILVSIFGALVAMSAVQHGLSVALTAYGIAFLLAALIAYAVYLIVE